MAQQGTTHAGHPPQSDPSPAISISSSVETICNICEIPYHPHHEQEFTFCCDRPIGAQCYQTLLDEGIECPHCGQNVQPKEPKPLYILRFGHRVAAEASVTPETPVTPETSVTPETTAPPSEDEMTRELLPAQGDCVSDDGASTRVQAFLLDSFERFLEDVRVFDEDALTEKHKLAMVKELEMQLGLRA